MFFTTCLLPEILGNWYTGVPPETSTSESNDGITVQSSGGDNSIPAQAMASGSNDAISSGSLDQELFCYCHGPEEGTMVGCDNEDCKIEWFHTRCLKIKTVPKGKWYCPDCRKLPQFTKGKGKAAKQ